MTEAFIKAWLVVALANLVVNGAVTIQGGIDIGLYLPLFPLVIKEQIKEMRCNVPNSSECGTIFYFNSLLNRN